MSQELNDYINDMDVYVFELNNGIIVVSEVIDIKDKIVELNYPLNVKDFKPFGMSIKQPLPLTSVKTYCEAPITVKHEYFKCNLIRKIVSLGGLTEQELFEFKIILEEDPLPFKIDQRFEKDLEPFYRNQKCPLNN